MLDRFFKRHKPEVEAELYHEQARDISDSSQFAGHVAVEHTYGPGDISSLSDALLANTGIFAAGSEFTDRVKLALATKVDDENLEDELWEIGNKVGEDCLAEYEDAGDILVSYLNAAYQLDQLKKKNHGEKASTDRTNAISHYAMTYIVANIEPSETNLSRIIAICDTIEMDLAPTSNKFNWYRVKATIFKQTFGRRVDAHDLIEKEYRKHVLPNEAITPDEVREVLKDAMDQISTLRKYGVKEAYTAATIGGTWIYEDGYDREDRMAEASHGDGNYRPSLYAVDQKYAHIWYSQREHHEDVHAEAKARDYGAGSAATGQTAAFFDPIRNFNLFLFDDGELYLDESGLLPLSEELNERPDIYALVSAELIANFMDLVLPAQLVRINAHKKLALMSPRERRELKPIRDLVLPRTRYIRENQDEIEEAFEEESESKRDIREHRVIWHTRELPLGWKASPEAVARAKRHNVTLAPNETFVKSHKRGTGNPVKSHKVKTK